jgi:hypothetical protein
MQQIMRKEVPDTLKLYLEDKIEQFWFREDKPGVIFLMNTESLDQAKAIILDRVLRRGPAEGVGHRGVRVRSRNISMASGTGARLYIGIGRGFSSHALSQRCTWERPVLQASPPQPTRRQELSTAGLGRKSISPLNRQAV